MSQKRKKDETQESIEEKKNLTKNEINMLLNKLDDIHEPKKDIKNDNKNKNCDNNQDAGNLF